MVLMIRKRYLLVPPPTLRKVFHRCDRRIKRFTSLPRVSDDDFPPYLRFSSKNNHLQSDACTRLFSSKTSFENMWESGKGLLSLLSDRQRTLRAEQRQISKEALHLAKEVGGVDLQHCATSSFLEQLLVPYNDDDDQAISERAASKQVLDSTFSVVIAGEFNAGKSTLINALLGQKLLETGALPTTDQITILTCDRNLEPTSKGKERGKDIHSVSYSRNDNETNEEKRHLIGNQLMQRMEHSNAIKLHYLPVSNIPLLGDITLIDTPGTNAVMSNHTERTMKLLPSADLILFVTSADRPFPDSEKKLLQSIQSYRKNIVIVINKMDVLDATGGDHGEVEKQKVAQFVADNAADLLGARAVVMPVSAKDALTAKLIHGASSSEGSSSKNQSGKSITETSKMWKRSNFSSLETFLKESLTDETKLRAKLLNPLGVTEGMLQECLQVLNTRKKHLESDTATVNLFKSQMDSWKKDMDIDMDQFRSDVHYLLEKEMNRCQSFVDNLGFIERFSFNMNNLEEKWYDTRSIEMTVSTSDNVEKELLNITREYSDSIAMSSRAQGQAVIEYLGKRPAVVGQNLIGSVTAASKFEDTRKDLHDKMAIVINNIFAAYDEQEEKKILFQSIKRSNFVSAGFNTLALSSGLSTALEFIDVVPGGALTFLLTTVGLGIIPLTNNKVVKDYEYKWRQRDEKLREAFDQLCSKEIKGIHKKIIKGVSPYTRYVKTEEESIASLQEKCEMLSNSTLILRNRI